MPLDIDASRGRPRGHGAGARIFLFAALPLTACAALAATVYRGHAETPAVEAAPPPPTAIVDAEKVVVVQRERISAGLPLSGELRSEREATARAEMGGSINGLRVQEGETVKEGQVLCRIQVFAQEDALTSAQQGVRSAETVLEAARRDGERTQALASEGLVARREADMTTKAVAAAEAELANATARVAVAREQLQKSIVRAPIDGVVSTRAAHEGDVVAPGAPLITIIDPSRMQLVASVPSDAVGALHHGARVEFRLPAYDAERFSGRITRISPAVDPLTRQVQIYVAVQNRPGRLVAGLVAEGRVTTATREALVVPADAVEANGGSPSVMRLRDGRAERVPVEIGLRDEQQGRIEIRSGLSGGDMLLTGRAEVVAPNARVEIARSAASR